MKLIVGLGNPGREYQGSRHNLGFEVIDYLAKKTDTQLRASSKFNAELGTTEVNGQKYTLFKPTTYMNNSGQAVAAYANYHQIPPPDITVIYDDVDLPLGEIRATGQSSGGHRGLQSIIDALGTDQIPRLRLGVISAEKPLKEKVRSFVLGKFTPEERKKIDRAIKEAGQNILRSSTK